MFPNQNDLVENLVVLIGKVILPALVPLLNLRSLNIDETAKAVWVLIILLLSINSFLMSNEKKIAGKSSN